MILEENLLFTHHTTRQLNQVGSVQSSIEFFTFTLSPNPASAMHGMLKRGLGFSHEAFSGSDRLQNESNGL